MPTLFTARAEVARAIAVAYVAVPALPAEGAVAAGLPAAADVGLPGAEAADPRGHLHLGQLPQVAALAVDEEVAHAAHVAQAQGGGPHLRGQDEALAVVG